MPKRRDTETRRSAVAEAPPTDPHSTKVREWLRNRLSNQAGHSRVKILLVDDQEANLRALVATLDQPDYELVTARSGEEALKRLLDDDFALIIVDVMMPGMDGYELASLVKQRERSRHVPIVFLTATGQDLASLYRSYAAGAVDCLTKPGDPDVIRAKVAVFAELHRKNLELHEKEDQLLVLAVEEQRRAGERRVRNLAEAIPLIVWTAQATGALEYLNGAGRRYLGLMNGDVAGVDLISFLHPEDADRVAAGWHGAVALQQPFSLEVRLKRVEDNTYRWHLCRGAPDATAGWLGTLIDIEDQKRAEARARFLADVGTEMQASLLDAGRIAQRLVDLIVPPYADLAVVDRLVQGRVERVSGAFARPELERLTSELATRWPETEAAPRLRMRALVDGKSRRLGDPGTPLADEEVEDPGLRQARRELGVRSVMVAPIRVLGKLECTLSVARLREEPFDDDDLHVIEELAHHAGLAISNARLYEQAQQSIRVRDDFLMIAAHELKTPITALKLQTQTLERRAPAGAAGDEVRSRMGAAGRAIARLTRLVDTVLDVSRLAGGQLRLERERCDLRALVLDVVERAGEEARRTGSAITVTAPAPVEGDWDGALLEDVIENLVANAIKYGAGKPIELAVELAGARARLVVRDAGIGIAKEAQARIFERYGRAVSERNYGGLGLGLFIAHEVVTAHGGILTVKSALGAGAEFSVELPVTPPAPST